MCIEGETEVHLRKRFLGLLALGALLVTASLHGRPAAGSDPAPEAADVRVRGEAVISGLVELIESGEVQDLEEVASLLQGQVTLTDTTIELSDGFKSLRLDLAPGSSGSSAAGRVASATLTAGSSLRLVEEGGAVSTLDLGALLETTLGLREEGPVPAPEGPSAAAVLAEARKRLEEKEGRRPLPDGVTSPRFEGPAGPRSAAAIGALELAPAAGSRGIDVLSSGNALSNGFFERIGWQGRSAPVGTGPSGSSGGQKVLEIVDRLTSNRFEVDLDHIRPGTIISNLPITISQPGFYYLIHHLTNTLVNGDGITIDANEVTLDLNGYALYGGKISGIASDDGIFVFGSQTNITIRNGSVVGWDGDGINALNADFSIFENLHVSQNDGDGLVADFNAVIWQCTAFSNGFDGLEGDDGTVILHSSAGQNGDNGIQTSEGSLVANCASFDNRRDGFDVGAGSVVDACVATDNGVYGFDVAQGVSIGNSTAYDNLSNGFDIASAGNVHQNVAAVNNGNGFRTAGNCYLRNNQAHENDLDGFHITLTDCVIEDNFATDNDKTGFNLPLSGSLFLRNRAAGNVTNFNITSGNAFGPIVDVTGAGDLSDITNTSHPQANLQF